MRGILKGPALVYYLVKELKKKYPKKQVGKTIIQKLMYIFELTSGKDFDYTMYHYGPYSWKVSEYLNLAEALNAVEIDWDPSKGYFVRPNDKPPFKVSIGEEEKKLMRQIIEKYGKFNAVELSIFTTAMYVKDRFGESDPENIVKIVSSLKPEHKKEWIKQILIKAEIVNETN